MKKVLMALAAGSLMASYASAQEVKAPAAEAKAPASWADKVTLKGDLRYRYEFIDQEGKEDRTRNRVRARAGLEAQASDTVTIGMQLSTSEGGDPVSSNQTLGNGSARKDVFFDLAFIDWQAADGLNLVAGKMKNPFEASDLVFDSDMNPEGVAASYSADAGALTLMANAGYFWVEERKADKDDAVMIGGQLGAKLKANAVSFLAAVGLYSFQNLKGYPTIVDAEDGFGNATTGGEEDLLTGEVSPLLYANDYELVNATVELALNLGVPVAFYGDYVVNNEADEDDTGYLAGFRVGKTKKPGSVEFNYNYRELEANAVLGAWTDSDFIGGGTDGKGHKLSLGVQLTKALKGQVTYFVNEIGLDDGAKDYDRVQVDVSAKF